MMSEIASLLKSYIRTVKTKEL